MTARTYTELTVNPKELYVPTGIELHPGQHYAFAASGKWRDWCKDCDADGWGAGLAARWNRVAGERFFLLCGTLGRDDRLAFAIGSDRPDWCVPDEVAAFPDRQLYLFANDWRWMYFNNHELDEEHGGPMRVRITRLS